MFRRIAFTLFAVSLLATASFAQSSASTSANASANLLTPITIAKVTDLDFGTLVAGPTPGTVVVPPAGSRTATGGASLVGTSYSPATFTVGGQASTAYSITLPSSMTITNTSNPSQFMTVNTFTSNPSGTGTLSVAGSQTLNVGATLQVPGSQGSGLYTGTFSVSVAY